MLRTQQVTAGRHAREGTEASAVDSVAERGAGPRMSLGDELRSVFDPDEEGKATVVRTVTYRTERVSRAGSNDGRC